MGVNLIEGFVEKGVLQKIGQKPTCMGVTGLYLCPSFFGGACVCAVLKRGFYKATFGVLFPLVMSPLGWGNKSLGTHTKRADVLQNMVGCGVCFTGRSWNNAPRTIRLVQQYNSAKTQKDHIQILDCQESSIGYIPQSLYVSYFQDTYTNPVEWFRGRL